jgi:predicted N-acyltransferase
LLVAGALALAQRLEVSSLRVLYPLRVDRPPRVRAGLMAREGVQFRWHNSRQQGHGTVGAIDDSVS